MALTIYLVRHLAPVVDAGVCYGRTDLAVNADPQALTSLRAQLPVDAPVYSSPLQRCAVLAQALFGERVIIDERLQEFDFGTWEMRRWDDIARAEVDAWAADLAHYQPGGGDSVLAMAQRVSAFAASLPAQGTAVIICHAGVIRLMRAYWQGLDARQMAQQAAAQPHAIAYGEVVRLQRP